MERVEATEIGNKQQFSSYDSKEHIMVSVVLRFGERVVALRSIGKPHGHS